ncbi:tandem-95 repeat protein [Gramella sp. MT6]|uniref:Ig-like domain-containing protein n=1 Tax=Gramella sp. MT6 TaxID=2705471 RepID=UPI001C5F738C|nr:Ig-like domain-containing protein [Gramella sp. MT6]QYA27097.1 tandem-95 repeat protein [Gramella sp. MT6]
MRIAVAALLYFSAFGFAYGQGPENTVPAYDHLTGVDLGTAGTSSLENIIISVAVDSQGFIYTLSFGNGVDKRNPDGSMNQEKLIPGNLLQDPLDIEIDSSGNIYIADYFESGSCLDNGKVKIFNSNGDFENEIAYSYFRPLGLAIDINDNIYVAEYYDGSTCESEEESRIRVFDSNGILLDQTNSVEIPFRLDVDSKSTLYVSQAGDDNPQVLYFDSNLNFQGTLSNIISPGSVVVDEFDFIHVVEYAGRVDFEKFLNYDELGFLDLLILASNIQEGIDRNEFGFKIFNSNKEFEYYYQDNQIRFPVDITINDHNCNTKLYLNNANINGTSLQFDLEIYERSPSFDLTDPVANCGGDFDLQLVNGSASISVEDVNNGSTDNCGIKDISLSKTTFTETGDFDVVMTVTDNAGNEDTCTVQVTVTGEETNNQPPNAVDDSYTVIENQTLNEAAPGVLINDTDSENDPLTAVLQTDVSNGTLELRPDGSFIYTPDPNYTGSDSFTYAANDGELNSNVVSVSITVTPEPNQAPSAVADSYTVIENQTLNEAAPGVLINDTDPENDLLTAVLQTDVSNGTLELRPNGSFIYTPDPNYTGTDSFTYAANDGELNSNVVSVSITVTPEPNQAPSAVADSYTVIENQTLSEVAPGVLINDTDPENDPLTAVLQTDVSNGTLELRPNGSFIYTPDPNYTGSDSFTYAANDGELNSNVVSVSITVTPQAEPNFDCPQEGDFEPITLAENCDFEVPDYRGSVTNFQNIENPVVRQTYIRNPDAVRVTLEVYDGNELVGDCTFDVPVLDETAPEILNCDSLNDIVTIEEGGVHQLGNYTEEVEVRDCSAYEVTQEPQSGTSINITTQVTITVTDDTRHTDTCTFTVEVREESEVLDLTCPGSYAVLADENCVYKVPDFSGIATANIDGAVIDQDIEAGSVFQPNSDSYVTVTATFEDQSDSCRIYLSPVDEEDPVARCVGDTEIRLAEGETIQLNAEDFDAGSSDNCQIATYNLDRNSLSSADEGENVITLTVNDAAGNLDFCEFTVNVIVEEPGEIDFSCLIVEYKLAPDENCEYFLPDFSEILEYSPAEADFEQSITSGTQLFEDIEVEVTVSYQGESKTCNLYVSLEDQPQAICRSDFQIQLDEGETVTIQPEDLDNGSFANCSEINLSLDKTEFTSADLGANIVTLTVTDEAGNTDTCQTTVNVVLNGSGVNQPPVAIDDEYTTSINTTLEVSASNGVLVNDTDPENDELTVILQDNVSNGTLDLNADGSFTYTPDQDFFGQDYFTYIANDGELNSNIIFVSINVEDGNGEFSCVERLTLSLNSEGSAELNIEDLYSGNVEGIEFGATERFFSCEDIGENTVTLVYTGKQEGSCEIVVEVIDMSAPVLALNDLEVSLNEAGVATLTFNDLDAGSRDNCNGEIIYTLSHSAFTCKNLGENEILVTAEDSSGNSSTRTAMVTVLDNEGFCNDFGEGSEYIFIYPNPNTGSFKIATPADVLIERIEVFDHRGRFIAARDYESTATEYPMEVGPLQESVYVVKIVTNERTLTKRFIFKY